MNDYNNILNEFANGSNEYPLKTLLYASHLYVGSLSEDLASKLLARIINAPDYLMPIYASILVKLFTRIDDLDKRAVYLGEILRINSSQTERADLYEAIEFAHTQSLGFLKDIDTDRARQVIFAALNSPSNFHLLIASLMNNCSGCENELIDLVYQGNIEAALPLCNDRRKEVAEKMSKKVESILCQAMDAKQFGEEVITLAKVIITNNVLRFKELATSVVSMHEGEKAIERERNRNQIQTHSENSRLTEVSEQLSDAEILRIVEKEYQKVFSGLQKENREKLSFKPLYIVYTLHSSIPGSEIFPPVFDVFGSIVEFQSALRNYMEAIKDIAFDQDEDWYDTYPEDEDEYIRITSDSNEDITQYSFEAFNVVFNILNASDEPTQIAESIYQAFSEYRFDEETLNDYEKEDLEELLDEYPLLVVSAWTILFKQPVDPDLFYNAYANSNSLNDSAPCLEDKIPAYRGNQR